MTNELKKIIISVEANKLKKIIVIKGNSIKSYSINKLSNDDLLSIYSKSVKELKKQYKDELEGLSPQETVDKLSRNGKIEYQKKNLITNIMVYDQGTSFEKLFINYEDGTKEEYNLSENNDYYNIKNKKLFELCNDYDLKYIDLVKSGLVKIINNAKKDVKKENKIKNLIIRNKKLLSTILAGAITVTGIGVGISRFTKKDNNLKGRKIINQTIETQMPKSIMTNTPYITLEPTISVTPTSTIKVTNTPKVTVTPTSTIKPTNTPSYTMTAMKLVTPPPISKLNEILFAGSYGLNDGDSFNDNVLARKNYGNIVYLKKDKLEDIISSLNEIRASNMSDIGKKKFDKKDLVIIYYENFLNNKNLYDKSFVKYFSNIGNKIIENAYRNNEEGFNEVNKYANLSNTESERLITNKEALEVIIDGKYEKVYFDNLSLDAKEIVQNIIFHNMQCLNNLNEENDYSDNLIVTNYYGVDFYVFGDNTTYKSMGIKGVQPHNACLIYSRAWASDYMSGTTNFDSSGLMYYGVATENKQTALKVIMTEVMKGRPVVIRVNAKQAFYKGKIKSTPRHFVTVCGFRKNANVNNLKESDFLIYDPTYSRRFKILGSHAAGGSNDRKLLKTEQNTGRRGPNYSDGYYLEVFNDSSNYLELDDVYEGKI